jgi:hypothetical protein
MEIADSKQTGRLKVAKKQDGVRVVDVNDPLFRAIASMTNEERRAMLKAALQKYKAKQLAAQREKDAGIPPTKEPT